MTLSAQQQNWSMVSHSGFFATPETPTLSDPISYIDHLKDTIYEQYSVSANTTTLPTIHLCSQRLEPMCTCLSDTMTSNHPVSQPMMAHSKSLIVRKDTSLLNSNLNDRNLFQLIVSNLLTLYILTLHLFLTHLPSLHHPHLLKPGNPDLDDVFSYLTVPCKLLIFTVVSR